ncbi:MAG: hypothetical protein UU64_C0002G0109 [candidate division WWE3 bacterium GW2011_GWF2_41_45]|uniref:Uncharacterized protein n=2 Tax=Katanobacteria TaxID=422282 RepID=A0A1F4W348_UNCKA|nr:MAG: hypothetical protein UU55_C0001G0009 [candidate division WWE3 bacterium GW2011_GWC2_41_23]KKS10707.1 MAG: hypothetical protein UU64_C0002G0109 [candidate division WWE3 bacterium GW2011_GWF2_41_45]KKS12282.1 MAG: hypothetical protein UU68_C0002G0008 [candidate division WWE3 bacterium GW2011_GWF1_41_53]KKS20355.1 MAG: hypothetical protein UU79_C0001G0009 [candidate division WWE3 bacterium GW2011_GWE1_41_72]KKS28188.1 MAG: hypothetical protein UU86_C0009G0018 [candidate division WWE3 bacte
MNKTLNPNESFEAEEHRGPVDIGGGRLANETNRAGDKFEIGRLLGMSTKSPGSVVYTRVLFRTVSDNIYGIRVGPDGTTIIKDGRSDIETPLDSGITRYQEIEVGKKFYYGNKGEHPCSTTEVKEIVAYGDEKHSQAEINDKCGGRQNTILKDFLEFSPS